METHDSVILLLIIAGSIFSCLPLSMAIQRFIDREMEWRRTRRAMRAKEGWNYRMK